MVTTTDSEIDPTLRESGTFRFCSVSSVTSASDLENPAASDGDLVVAWSETHEAVIAGSVAGRDSGNAGRGVQQRDCAFATPAPVGS